MPMTAVVFWIVYVGGICAAVIYPVVGVALYILVYHLDPETQWWGRTFDQAGIRPSMTVAAATVVGILLRRPRFTDGARQFPLPMVLMLALVGYALLTLMWATPSWALTGFMAEKVAKLGVFILILVRCVRRPEHYQLAYLSWLAGVAFLGYQAWGGIGADVGGRLAWGLGGPDFGTSSGLATHLVATLPLLGALFFMSPTWWGRGFALLAGALAVNTIIMTRTRSVLVGLAAMCMGAVFWLPKGYRAKGLAAIVVGTVLAVQLTDPAWWARMETVQTYRQDSSAVSRLVFWRAALEMAHQQPLGIGLGQFRLRIQEFLPGSRGEHSAHSTAAECLAELGVPGFVLLILLVVATFLRLGRMRRAGHEFALESPIELGPWTTRFHLGWHAMALQAALAGYLGCALFTSRMWAEDFWMLLALAVSLQNVRLHMQARAAATGPAASAPTAAAPVARTPALPGVPAPAGAWPGEVPYRAAAIQPNPGPAE